MGARSRLFLVWSLGVVALGLAAGVPAWQASQAAEQAARAAEREIGWLEHREVRRLKRTLLADWMAVCAVTPAGQTYHFVLDGLRYTACLRRP